MHKRTHLTVSEGGAGERERKRGTRSAPKRSNRRRRDWNRILRWAALGVALLEVGVLLLANPYLHVTRVRVDGMQTLSPEQVLQEARVPRHTNIFWMLRQPFSHRLSQDPVIDHSERSIHLPNLLVLTVHERQPKVVLAGNGQFWLLDKNYVAYRQVNSPMPGIPTVQVVDAVMPAQITPGQTLQTLWLADAFFLLSLQSERLDLSGLKIVVDQNSNLCLNRKDGLQIRLGQPDALPQKLALAVAAMRAYGNESAYIDVSSPELMVRMPRKDKAGIEIHRENNGPQSRTD